MGAAPLISIVVATYNASHVLRYAIKSVLGNDCQDWELIVVGDHCTDDTAEVLAAFGDERIRYVNLPANSGQQAKPNNHGLGLARGEYLCYLNHDDLYLPFHLTQMLEASRRAPHSILLCAYADVRTKANDEGARETDCNRLQLTRVGPARSCSGYDPRRWQIASSWFMPRAVALRVGLWRMESETLVTPSQDWLFRAWHQGVPVVGIPQVSVVSVCTGARRHFYASRQDDLHERVFQRYVLTDKQWQVLEELPQAGTQHRRSALRRTLRKCYDATVCRLSARLGYHPNSLEMLVRFGGRGGFIRSWRKRVDLD